MYYTYVLLSKKDSKWYIGYTNNLKERYKDHQEGKVESTKHRRPLKLVYYEVCLNQYDALRRERYLKSGRGKAYLKKRLKKYLEQ